MKTLTIYKIFISCIWVLFLLSGCKLNTTPQIAQYSMIDESDKVENFEGRFDLSKGFFLGSEFVSIAYLGEKVGYRIQNYEDNIIADIRFKRLDEGFYYAEISPKAFKNIELFNSKHKSIISHIKATPVVPAVVDAKNPYFLKIYPVIYNSILDFNHAGAFLSEKYSSDVHDCSNLLRGVFDLEVKAICIGDYHKNIDKEEFFEDIKKVATTNRIPSLALSNICAIAGIEYDLSSLEKGYFKVGDVSFNLEDMEAVGLPYEIVPTISKKICKQHIDIASKEPKEQIEVVNKIILQTYPWEPSKEKFASEPKNINQRPLTKGEIRWPETGNIIIPVGALRDEFGVSEETFLFARQKIKKFFPNFTQIDRKNQLKIITDAIFKEHLTDAGTIAEMIVKTNVAFFFGGECASLLDDSLRGRDFNEEKAGLCMTEQLYRVKVGLFKSAGKQFKKYSREQLIDFVVKKIGEKLKDSPLRSSYEAEVRRISSKIKEAKNLSDDQLIELVAREAHNLRRAIGVKYKDMTPKPLRDYIYYVNEKRYGNKLGPKFEKLVEKAKKKRNRSDRDIFISIIESASKPHGNIDNLLSGFKDWLNNKEITYLLEIAEDVANL